MSSKLPILNPYNLNLIAEAPLSGDPEIESKLHILEGAKEPLPLAGRLEILAQVAKLVEEAAGKLSRQISAESGKPIVDAEIEVRRAVEGIREAISVLGHMAGRQIPMGRNADSLSRLAFTLNEPIGLVYAISASNHPLNLIVHQVIPAIAVGCPVLIKPCLETPLSCLSLVRMLYEAGLPKSWCQVILCENALAEKIACDKRVQMLNFIGSAQVGWSLRSKIAPGTRCMLEHGGVAPALICEDGAVHEIIPLLTRGAFYHAGQVCVSLQNIYVHECLLDTFVEAFVATVKLLKVGDPSQRETQVGPLLRQKELLRIGTWVNESGGQVLTGGSIVGETCFAPTVVLKPSPNSLLVSKEVFGPVVNILPFNDYQQVLDQINASPYAFQASVFTQDLDRAMRFVQKIRASSVFVNDVTTFRTDWMPFGGRRLSGMGKGGIGYSMKEMTEEKMFSFYSPSLTV